MKTNTIIKTVLTSFLILTTIHCAGSSSGGRGTDTSTPEMSISTEGNTTIDSSALTSTHDLNLRDIAENHGGTIETYPINQNGFIVEFPLTNEKQTAVHISWSLDDEDDLTKLAICYLYDDNYDEETDFFTDSLDCDRADSEIDGATLSHTLYYINELGDIVIRTHYLYFTFLDENFDRDLHLSVEFYETD